MEDTTLYVVLEDTGDNDIVYARSQNGLMIYATQGIARAAAKARLRENSRGGFNTLVFRIVPITSTETMREMWDDAKSTEVRTGGDR